MKIILKIVPIILIAAMLMACAANDRQVTEAPTTNASEVSTVETEPAEQVKTFNFTEPVSTPKPTEAVRPTETTVANTPTEATEAPTETDVSPTETEPTPDATEAPTEAPAETEPVQTYGGYSDADINRMATVANGEIGGIVGTITVTYADGTQVSAGQDMLRMIHARVLVNQVHSSMFPNSLSSCIRTYWSSSYDNPYRQSSSRWQSCRQAVVNALNGGVYVPSNVYAATCDPSFGSRYSGYHLYARVDWNTGYVSGTFYYYAYG